jgi:hypothetical protein
MAKKKKKQKAKKTARMKEKARQRRKRRRARSSEGTQGNILHIGGRPSMSSMEPPEGFRTIGMAQSTFLYGQPIIELAEKKGVDLEEAMNISMLLWNHALLVERQGDDPSAREPIVCSLV